MPWFKVDDGFHGHPKVIDLSVAAVGIWTLAGSWCAKYLTDGHVTTKALYRLGGDDALAAELVASGLWLVADGGYRFKDWEDYQPLKDDVEAEREAARDRMRVVRAKSKGVQPTKQRTNSGSSDEQKGNDRGTSKEVRVAPSLPDPPDPTRPEIASNEARNVAEIRPDVSRLCNLLADLIEGNGSKRPTIGKGWHDAARLMIDADKRPLAEIVSLIQWAQADSFWRGNVLSMPKFRDKYDTLRLQRETKMKAASSEPTRAPRRVVSGRVQ